METLPTNALNDPFCFIVYLNTKGLTIEGDEPEKRFRTKYHDSDGQIEVSGTVAETNQSFSFKLESLYDWRRWMLLALESNPLLWNNLRPGFVSYDAINLEIKRFFEKVSTAEEATSAEIGTGFATFRLPWGFPEDALKGQRFNYAV